ncbi:MAG: YHS domain-containing protein [Desulfobacteraceae bacterium]|nr:YHS domain-containing protein [Desulfobacteraceae bacterium]
MNHSHAIQNHKDPVCGMDLSSENNEFTFDWNNHTYNFCSEHCRNEFEKSPETYLKKSSFFLKRWWDNYLKRLNKATKGKKPKCCDKN